MPYYLNATTLSIALIACLSLSCSHPEKKGLGKLEQDVNKKNEQGKKDYLDDYEVVDMRDKKEEQYFKHKQSEDLLNRKILRDLNKNIEQNSSDPNAFYKRGKMYAIMGQHEKAIIDYNKAIEMKPDNINAYTQRGRAHRTIGNTAKAFTDLNKSIEMEQNNVQSFIERGRLYAEKKQYENAFKDFQRALVNSQNRPNTAKLIKTISYHSAIAYYNKGNDLLEKKHYDQAIDAYNISIKQNPRFAPAYNNRGIAYFDKNSTSDEQLHLSHLSITLTNKDETGFSIFGEKDSIEDSDSEVTSINNTRAIKDFTQAIVLKPVYSDAFFNRGTAFSENGQLESALSDFNQAILLNPDKAMAFLNKGNVLAQMGRLNDAIHDYTNAIRLLPKFAQAYLNRGKAYILRGKNNEEGCLDWHKACELDLCEGINFGVSEAYCEAQ